MDTAAREVPTTSELPQPHFAGPANGWRVLTAALIAQTANSVVTQGFPTLAPFLQADMGLSRTEVGLFPSFMYIGYLFGAVLAGWATDTLGDRAVLVTGVVATGVAAMFSTRLSGGGLLLVAALVLVGIAAAASTPAGSHAVMRAFPSHQRGLMMGIRQTGIPLGGVLAAAALPPVALVHGWRGAMLAAGALAAVAGVLSLRIYRRTPGPRRTNPAGTGPAARVITRDVLMTALAGVILPIGQFCMVTYLILYLQEHFHIAIVWGAAMLTMAQLAGAGGRVLWSGASDWVFGGRRRPALVLVVALSSLSALVLSVLSADVSKAVLVAVIFVFGLSAVGWQGLYYILLTELAAPGSEGRAAGVGLVFNAVGIILGPPLFGLLVDRTSSYRLAWALLAAVLVLGAVLLWNVRERPSGQPVSPVA